MDTYQLAGENLIPDVEEFPAGTKCVQIDYTTIDDNCEEVILRLLDEPTLWEDFYSIEDIVEELKDGLLFGWLFTEPRVLLLFNFVLYPKAKVLDIRFVAGNPGRYKKPIMDNIEALACRLGCSMVRGITHPVLAYYAQAKCGYTLTEIVARKYIRQGGLC